MMTTATVGFNGSQIERKPDRLPFKIKSTSSTTAMTGNRDIMKDIILTTYPCGEIKRKREQVRSFLLQRSTVIKGVDLAQLSSNDLELMFELYDQVFIEGWIQRNYSGRMQFSISRKMTNSAGKTVCLRNDSSKPDSTVIEVRISQQILSNYGMVEGADMVGGIKTGSRLEALQLIFEHELIHVIEFICFGESSCKQSRFKTMADNLFGHKENYHQLPTNKQIAQQRLGLSPGSAVAFPYQDRKLEGILCSIRKRASVMVSDKNGRYCDKEGQRYSKYLVPLQLLEAPRK